QSIEAGAPLPKRLLGHIVAELGPHGAWFDHRHADPLKSQLLAESVMESDDGKLGRAIDGPALNTVSAAGARHRRDHRAGPSLHQRNGGTRAVEYAVDIGIDHPAPVLGRAAGEQAEDAESCVVEEEVEAAEPRANLVEEGVHLI